MAADDDEDEDEDLALTAFRPEDETIGDRIAALKDILSPSTRARLSRFTSSVTSYAYFGGKIGGRLAWVGMTSALLVGLPLALTIENEGMLVQQEKEYYQQQQGQQQVRPPALLLFSLILTTMHSSSAHPLHRDSQDRKEASSHQGSKNQL